MPLRRSCWRRSKRLRKILSTATIRGIPRSKWTKPSPTLPASHDRPRDSACESGLQTLGGDHRHPDSASGDWPPQRPHGISLREGASGQLPARYRCPAEGDVGMTPLQRATLFMGSWATRNAKSKQALHRRVRLAASVYDLMVYELAEQFVLSQEGQETRHTRPTADTVRRGRPPPRGGGPGGGGGEEGRGGGG